MAKDPFILSLSLARHLVADWTQYPFALPAIKHFSSLELHPNVTFFCGENGTGKSTLLEGIAVLEGFNAEGGTRGFRFETRRAEYPLARVLGVSRGLRGKLRSDGFFFRAESFFNAATYIEEIEGDRPPEKRIYGDRSLHEQSHGESFLQIFLSRLTGNGLYLFDEPEAALSPQRQLVFLRAMHDLVNRESQLIVATHSPILMAYPGATIYWFDETGIRQVAYEETEHYKVTKAFLNRRETVLDELFKD